MPRARRTARLTTILLGATLLGTMAAPIARAGEISAVDVVTPNPAPEANHTFNIAARPLSNVQDTGGTLTFYLDGSVTPEDGCSALDPGAWGNYAYCAVGTLLDAGFHTVKVEYTGTALIDPSSREVEFTVAPDVVHATAFQQYLTFYPVKDGYRDKVIISGERQEPSTATVRIYAPSGSLIKQVGFADASTPFAYAWDGRNAAGAVRAEGKYKITVTFIDAFDNSLTAVGFVTLSRKKLIWHTKTIERTGKSADDGGGHFGGAYVFADKSYIKIIPNGGDGQAAWDFTIPSAVAYDSLVFKAYAKHQRSTGDTTSVGLFDFTSGCSLGLPAPDTTCFGGLHPLGNASGTTAWFRSASVLSGFRYGRLVTGVVYGTKKVTYVYKVQLVVKYATLGY